MQKRKTLYISSEKPYPILTRIPKELLISISVLLSDPFPQISDKKKILDQTIFINLNWLKKQKEKKKAHPKTDP